MALPDNDKSELLLVDDHPAVRHSLTILLEAEGHVVTGEAGSYTDALTLLKEGHFDMAIVDLTLKEGSGLTLLTDLEQRKIPSLVYSMHESPNTVERALSSGARGYVTKREDPQILIKGVTEVLKGNRYVSPCAAQNFSGQMKFYDTQGREIGLSDREAQVIRLMGQGEMNSEIATALNISARTVETYYARILDKLGILNVKDLRKYAISINQDE